MTEDIDTSPRSRIDNPDQELLEDADVRESPDLLPVEKQFSITSEKTDDRLRVYAEISPAIRWLLAQPEAKVTMVHYEDGAITGAKATIPRSLLLLKSKPRKRDDWNLMFVKPEEES